MLIANRKCHAGLLAMLEKEDVKVNLSKLLAWRQRQEDWRHLRHKRAIREFHEELRSKAYTTRRSGAGCSRAGRARGAARGAHRLAASARRDALAQPQERRSRRAQAQFKTLYEAEDAAISGWHEELEALKEAKGLGEGRKVALRAELHVYGALEPEPDLEQHACEIEAVLGDTTLDAFFRSSGGLKSELQRLRDELRNPQLIYASTLDPAAERLRVMLCALGLHGTLERQGKAGQQKALQDTLERLRKASKSEVPPLLPLLQQQVTEMAAVADLDPLLVELLRAAGLTTSRWTSSTAAARGSKQSGKSGGSGGHVQDRRPRGLAGVEGLEGRRPRGAGVERAGRRQARARARWATRRAGSSPR